MALSSILRASLPRRLPRVAVPLGAGGDPRRGLATFDGRVLTLDDGSESTKGQAGTYRGEWDKVRAAPHGGFGAMIWDNGISYEGD
jgi:hypothetical protein